MVKMVKVKNVKEVFRQDQEVRISMDFGADILRDYINMVPETHPGYF